MSYKWVNSLFPEVSKYIIHLFIWHYRHEIFKDKHGAKKEQQLSKIEEQKMSNLPYVVSYLS